MPYGDAYSVALRDSRKRAEAPFKAPFYTEPNHTYKSRKGAQLAFRKKHEVLRKHVKSVYATPGLHTDDYHHHTTRHVEPLPLLKQTDKVRHHPESFSVVHTFKSYDRRVKERPLSAGSIETEKSSIYDEKEQGNDFKESRGHSRFTIHSLLKRPQSAGADKSAAAAAEPEETPLQYSKVHSLLADLAKKRSSKTRDKDAKASEMREQREVDARHREEKAKLKEQRRRLQEEKKYPTLENMHKHHAQHEEYKRFKGTKVDLLKDLPPEADPFVFNALKPRPKDFEVNADDLMRTNEHLLQHPSKKPVLQPSTLYELKIAQGKGVDVFRNNIALSRLEAEFNDPEVVMIEKRVVERELRLLDGNLRPRHDGSRGGFQLKAALDAAEGAPAATKLAIPIFRKKASGKDASSGLASAASFFGGSGAGAKTKLGALVKRTSIDALRRIAAGPPTKAVRIAASEHLDNSTKDNVTATATAGSNTNGRPSSAPHSKVKQLHKDPFYYDALHHKEKDKHSHEHIGLGNGEVVKDMKKSGHSAYIYVDGRGKIHVQLKSKSSKTRPKSAEMSKFRSYKDKKRKVTMNDVMKMLKGGKATKTYADEHGLANVNLPSKNKELIVNKDLNKNLKKKQFSTAVSSDENEDRESVNDFDFEAADKRRLKTVQFNRERLSQINSKRLKMKEYMQFIASNRDVNMQEGKYITSDQKGKLGTITVERLALEKFYHSMGGDGWRRSDNWLSDLPVGAWFGITTNHLGAVRDIRLENNFLRGELIPSLADFEFLEVLVLDSNQICGQIHGHVIIGWKYLEVLSIRSNRLEGIIPLNLLAKKQLLRELWLSDNQLSGTLHEDLGSMQSLTHFCVYKNRLTGSIPSTIGKLHSLELLSLGRNSLSGTIPDALRSCIKLTHLSLHSNDFTGRVPEYFLTFPYLLELNLWRNMFDGEVPLRVAREQLAEGERERGDVRL